MTAEELLEHTARDLPGRLRWRVMRLLGISPVSAGGLLLSRRRALRLACQLVLDAGDGTGRQWGVNPQFDMARFRRLRGGDGA